MSRRLGFHPAAEAELNEASDFYDLQSPGLGDGFVDDVEHALEQIRAFPEAAPVSGGYRRRLLSRFPYALVYSVREDEIRVMAVAHLRRRPFYWRGRR